MHVRKLYPAILGSCLAVFTATVFAQAAPPPSSSSSPAAAAPSSAPAAGKRTAARHTKARHGKAHHAKARHVKARHARAHHAMARGARHASHASQMPMSSGAYERETPYRSALKRCVEGQAQQRDACLNDAIARYGRS